MAGITRSAAVHVHRRLLWAPTMALFWALAVASPGTPALAVDVFRVQDRDGAVMYTNLPPEPRGVSLLSPPPASPPPTRTLAWPDPATAARRPRGTYDAVIRSAAIRHGVDERLVSAIVLVESAGNPRAVSPKGALGLMQLMPQLATQLEVHDPFDPAENVVAGVRHLQRLLTQFPGRLDLALAAYNAGEQAVRASRGVPPYPETRRYVEAVLRRYGEAGASEAGPPRADAPRAVTRPAPAGPARETPAPRPGAVELPPAGPPSAGDIVYRYVQPDGTILLTNIPRNDGERP
jgi:Transglycosylase SLT domain